MLLRALKNAPLSFAVLSFVLLPFAAHGRFADAATHHSIAPVTLTDQGSTFTLANGEVTAKIDKSSASLLSLTYKGIDLLGEGDRSNGYWSMPGTHYRFGPNPVVKVLDDPASNGGARATISIRFNYDGDAKTVPADVDIHYSLVAGPALDLHGGYLGA